MRAIRLTAFAASLLLASGCVVYSNGGGGGGGGPTGSLTVTWTFGGSSCSAAGVDQITIDVQGTTTTDQATKQVSCAADAQGITIDNFVTGTYDVTVTGADSSGHTLFGMSSPESVAINAGNNSYAIDVPALTGDLTVYWGQFGSNADCTAAGIPQVRATLLDSNGQQVDDQVYACSAGGVNWPQIPPETYTVILNGIGSDGMVYYANSSQVDVTAGQARDYTVDLADNTGQLKVQWQFAGSSACGSVTTVHIKVVDPNGNVLDDNSYPCTDGGEIYDTTPAGPYTATAEGSDGSGQVIYSGSNANITVVAGTTQTYIVNMQ